MRVLDLAVPTIEKQHSAAISSSESEWNTAASAPSNMEVTDARGRWSSSGSTP
jgi:hypothetical protein